MTIAGHLWAIGYKDMEGAHQAQNKMTWLGWHNRRTVKHLVRRDVAILVRGLDGKFAFDGNLLPDIVNILVCTTVGFLLGLTIGAPLRAPLSVPGWVRPPLLLPYP